MALPREFPKMVYLNESQYPNGGIIVKNAKEEAELRGVPYIASAEAQEDDIYNNAPASYEIDDDILPFDMPDGDVVKVPSASELPQFAPDLAAFSSSEAEKHEISKEDLQKEADNLGVIYDKRWGSDKLQNAINEQKILQMHVGLAN